MGNHLLNRNNTSWAICDKFTPPNKFLFHALFDYEPHNGMYFNSVYLPEEIVRMIFSHLSPKDILNVSLVCKLWCNIVKSDLFWQSLYTKRYNKRSKKLPWYVYYCLFATKYFDTNLLKNGNGQDGFNNWQIIFNYGDEFRIEATPKGANPLPDNVQEFNGKTSCFATSYYECNKLQEIHLNNRLLQYILNKHKPVIYVSEWVAGRFDCSSVYTLWCKLYGSEETSGVTDDEEFPGSDSLHTQTNKLLLMKPKCRDWSKVELSVADYPNDVCKIVFQHEGKDTQFWKGHYGSKMAGGVVKIVFDSINQ